MKKKLRILKGGNFRNGLTTPLVQPLLPAMELRMDDIKDYPYANSFNSRQCRKPTTFIGEAHGEHSLQGSGDDMICKFKNN
jgi:hypothetical protein